MPQHPPAAMIPLTVSLNTSPSGPIRRGADRRTGKGRLFLVAAAVLIVLTLVAGGGLAAYRLITTPHPTLTVISSYGSGDSLGGPPDTILHISGQDFSSNSTITFLLDDNPAPGATFAQSDGNGNFRADLTITDDWTISTHTLTARDASGYTAQSGVTITVIPQPIMTVTSKYNVGSTLAGSKTTRFTVTGKRFSPNSTVTFLLDSQQISNTPSDAKGRIQVNLTVTSAWSLGNHTLAAKDNQGYATQQSVPIIIVAQGVADTPGPNGAPADDATFAMNTTTGYLYITGHPDPNGGTVCNPKLDDGQAHVSTGTLKGSGKGYTETIIYSCSGSYKSSRLTYTEAETSDQFILSDGTTCALQQSFIALQVDATFSGSRYANGTLQRYYSRAPCSDGSYVFRNAQNSSWSGAVSTTCSYNTPPVLVQL